MQKSSDEALSGVRFYCGSCSEDGGEETPRQRKKSDAIRVGIEVYALFCGLRLAFDEGRIDKREEACIETIGKEIHKGRGCDGYGRVICFDSHSEVLAGNHECEDEGGDTWWEEVRQGKW